MSPPSSKRNSGNGTGITTIDKLDYPPNSPRRPLLAPDSDTESQRRSQETSYAGSFFEQVAEGIYEQDRVKMQRAVLRWLSFVWAIVICLCAGSITAFSLYGHLFQSKLHYTQVQVNVVSIGAELGLYLLVPIFGYLCDRLGPGVPAGLAGTLFGAGYFLAAFAYRSGPPPSAGGHGWPFGVMVLAFALVGMGTSCMYLSAVTTCAKNFGRGNAKGVALAVPIAAFGLSGMWQSQVGSRLLYEKNADGSRGDVDVFRFFLFLGILLLCVGAVGFFALRIMDEEEMIDEAVDELERSGLLQRDEFFTQAAHHHGYGTMETQDLSDSTFDFLQSEAERLKAKAEEEARKKTWLLNEETRRYIMDPTMWWLAGGFFLVTGPGEAFINNLGTIIETLTPAHVATSTSPATHVSIVAITSTLARLITGTLSDVLAPVAEAYQHHRGPESVGNSFASLPPLEHQPRKYSVSRITFLVAFAFILSLGQLLLATGWVQNHASRFAAVSALIGAGYGAVFSLTPIVVSVVWGVENFGTNWGILAMTPAAGATLWGAVYATVYQKAADSGEAGIEKDPEDVLCHGKACYAPTFWAMTVSVWFAMGLFMWAWRGPGGWKRRGIAV